MKPRWSWDFEDDPRPRPIARPEPAVGSEPAQRTAVPGAQRAIAAAQIRRRRGAAAVVALLLVALAISALAGGHHARAKTSAKAPAGLTTRPHVRPPSTDTEADGRAAVRSVLAYTPFVKEGGSSGHDVALTFDDGPGPYTPKVLEVLERLHVHATFFEIGKMLQYFGESTRREIADGDVIGDHTETHPEMARLSARDQHEQLFEQMLRIELAGGRRPQLFRPPYGSFDATTMRELRSLGLLMVLWSVDTEDYLQPGVPTIVTRALEGLHPGAIILMHDAGGDREQTIAALPQIIRGIRERGYRLVTVPQLLADDPPPHGLPLPPSLAGD